MYGLIIIIHVIACLFLIAVILFQSGRGAGVSELFGSSATQTIFGTRASTFLTRTTTTCAVIFLFTCISLTIFSSSKMRSLMTQLKESPVAKEVLPQPAAQATGGIPVEIEEEKPLETTAPTEAKTEPQTTPQEVPKEVPEEAPKETGSP